MTLRVQETEHDHIPEEFTLESLKEGGFTDEEIERLSTGDDPIFTPEPAADDKAATPDPDAAAADGADPDIAEQATAEDDAAKVAADAEAQATADAEAAKVVEEVPAPDVPDIPDTSAAEAYVAKADDELAALLTKYDDGDLTAEEYREQQKFIISEQARAQADIKAAESLVQNTIKAQQQHWFDRLDAYKAAAPELWSEDHLQGWDRQLHAVTGNDAYADLSRDAQIKMAHRLYAAEYEARNGKPLDIAPVGDKAVDPKADPKADKGPDEKLEVKTGEKPKALQTLADFNSDTGAEVEDSRFAAIDRQIMKDPISAEAAFASMTPEQQDRYLEEV